jgi:hypothetical protein
MLLMHIVCQVEAWQELSPSLMLLGALLFWGIIANKHAV